MTLLKVAALAAVACCAGCASTRDTLEERTYRMTTLIRSEPPGYEAYLGKTHLGKTPVEVTRPYTHLTEELTFGNYRTGMVLAITGGAGVAVAGGMVAGGVVLMDDDSGAGAALVGLGMVGMLYGLIATGYGAVAMIGSTGTIESKRTDPHKLVFGVKGPGGDYHEMEVKPVNDRKRHLHLDQVRKVTFVEGSGKWWVPGLKDLKVEVRGKAKKKRR